MYDSTRRVSGEPVAIRRAGDDDLPQLHDLAELDSAEPLTGAVLVAVIEGRPVAALSLDDDRTLADPFRATEAAVELLRLRARQLLAGQSRPRHSPWRRWFKTRARA